MPKKTKGSSSSSSKSGKAKASKDKSTKKEVKELRASLARLEKQLKKSQAAAARASKPRKSASKAVVPRGRGWQVLEANRTQMHRGAVASGSWSKKKNRKGAAQAAELLLTGRTSAPLDIEALAKGGGVVLGDDLAGPAHVHRMRAVLPQTRHLYPEVMEMTRNTIQDSINDNIFTQQ